MLALQQVIDTEQAQRQEGRHAPEIQVSIHPTSRAKQRTRQTDQEDQVPEKHVQHLTLLISQVMYGKWPLAIQARRWPVVLRS
ncbi:hypothetical protein D3C81_2199140 [compost metagenome]